MDHEKEVDSIVGKQKITTAGELVLLAMLIALCVLFNEICAHTLPLHAGTALVIIAGITLGPKAGMIVGSLSRLVCNIFDGQGPWTIWQMVAWGLLGVLAGVAFYKVERRKNWEKITVKKQISVKRSSVLEQLLAPVAGVLFLWLIAYLYCLLALNGEEFVGWRMYVYGFAGLVIGFLIQRKKLSVDSWTMAFFTFFTVFLVYGGIMNFATLFLNAMSHPSDSTIDVETLKLLYVSGVPYDLTHAGGAAICIFFFGDMIVQKIVRIQKKFGWK